MKFTVFKKSLAKYNGLSLSETFLYVVLFCASIIIVDVLLVEIARA